MAESIIFKGSSGLNNKIDPLRHPYNSETGIGSLSASINCDIDDSGAISRRDGQVELSSVFSHSVFCAGGDCFVVQDRASDAAIYKVGTDFSLTGIRSGLTKAARIAFVQDEDKTYYSNGVQNGVIENGVSDLWPTEDHVGTDGQREFYPAPIGTHLDIWLDRMWIAEGSVLWVSEVFAYGKFNKSKYYFPFNTDIRMIKHVEGGMWVSTAKEVAFIAKEDKFSSLRYVVKSLTPAHEYSVNQHLVDLSQTENKVLGLSAVWSSDDGLTVGTASGELIVLTERKLVYPTGGSGATVVDDSIVINSIW